MNVPKVDELDYINFLIAAQRVFSTVEAAKVSPEGLRQPAHDAYTRLLQHTPGQHGTVARSPAIRAYLAHPTLVLESLRKS